MTRKSEDATLHNIRQDGFLNLSAVLVQFLYHLSQQHPRSRLRKRYAKTYVVSEGMLDQHQLESAVRDDLVEYGLLFFN